jgi:hypothetical protein
MKVYITKQCLAQWSPWDSCSKSERTRKTQMTAFLGLLEKPLVFPRSGRSLSGHFSFSVMKRGGAVTAVYECTCTCTSVCGSISKFKWSTSGPTTIAVPLSIGFHANCVVSLFRFSLISRSNYSRLQHTFQSPSSGWKLRLEYFTSGY